MVPDDVRRPQPHQPNVVLDAPLRPPRDGSAVLVGVVAAGLAVKKVANVVLWDF